MKGRNVYLKLLSVSLIVALCFTITGCGKEEAPPSENAVAVSVGTKTMVNESIEQYKNISSTVVADSEVHVVPKVSGTVSKVYVKLGDQVRAGDVLFDLDDTDLRLQLETSQAAINASEAALNSTQASSEMNTGSTIENQLTQLKSNIRNLEIQYNDLLTTRERTESLYNSGVVAKVELDGINLSIETTQNQLNQARNSLNILENQTVSETNRIAQASVNQAQAALAQSQASLKSVQQQLAYTRVTAEIDGIVSACSVTEGAMVSQQSSALTLVNMDRVKISFNVSDDYINRVHTGAKAFINISAASDQPFEGTVANIAPAASNTTMLYPVEIFIPNPNHLVKPGMFASLKLVLGQVDNVMVVPLNTVLEKNGEKYLFTVDENNVVHRTVVDTGAKNDVSVAITSGLKLGDKVVVTGQDFISDGTTVNITESQ